MATGGKVDVKVGDKVRVTFEGVVEVADEYSFGTGDYFFDHKARFPGRTVEIVERTLVYLPE